MFSISAWEARCSVPIRRTRSYTHLRACSSKRWKPRMFPSELGGMTSRGCSICRRCSGQMRPPRKSGGRFIWEWICLLNRERRFALRSMASCIFWRKIRLHLTRETLEALKPGQAIAKGEIFARVGTSHENGGWPPHLHFQMILDLLDRGAEFPGVARASERAIWTSLSPDPNLLLGIPAGKI